MIVESLSPDVSVVICTHGRPAQLERLLESINLQETSLSHEVIVVDNKPSASSLTSLMGRFASIHWAIEPRTGLSFARNTGIRLAKAAVVVLVDDDIEVPRGWLQSLVTPIFNEGWDAVTGPTIPFKLETQAERLFEAYGGHGHKREREFYDRSWLARQRVHLPIWRVGPIGNSAFRRRVFEDTKLGLLDQALGAGTPAGSWEDLYFFYLMLRANYRILREPTAYVRHAHRESMQDLSRQLCDYRRGEVCFCILIGVRHGDLRSLSHLFLWIPYWRFKLLLGEAGRRHRGERLFSFGLMARELLAYLSGPAALLVSLWRAHSQNESR